MEMNLEVYAHTVVLMVMKLKVECHVSVFVHKADGGVALFHLVLVSFSHNFESQKEIQG